MAIEADAWKIRASAGARRRENRMAPLVAAVPALRASA
jgi:hypothetical protein